MRIFSKDLLMNKSGGGVEIYEFIIDTSNSNPTNAVTYAGANASYTPASMDFSTGAINYGSWGSAFFQPRPVMVKSNGTVDYELNPDDFTKKKDGTASDVSNTSYDGNCMIAFPQIWMKFVQDDATHQHVYIASEQIDSSYHCYTHQNKTGTWLDEIFINAFEPSNVSNKLRSLAGQTVLDTLSGETMQTYAKANGSAWDFMDYGELQMLQMLCVLMFKSLDTQSKIGAGVVGGSNTTYQTTGATKDKGMFYAVNNTASSQTPIKVFGIENLWGNRYKWINGLVIPKGASATATASVKYKLCDFTSDGSTVAAYSQDGTGYKTLTTFTNGGTAKSGYPNKLLLNSDGLFADPANLSGSNSTYVPDYAYFGGSNFKDYNLFARFGGNYNGGSYAGLFLLVVNYPLAYSNVVCGASLSCKHLTSTTSGCILYNTKILMSDNSTKFAEDIKIGDKVVSYDINNKEFVITEIINVMPTKKSDLFKVIFDDNSFIELTSGHPLLSNDNIYKAIKPENTNKARLQDNCILEKLNIGDEIIGKPNKKVIDIIELDNKIEYEVYDFTVSNNFKNFVANDVVIHNIAITGGSY